MGGDCTAAAAGRKVVGDVIAKRRVIRMLRDLIQPKSTKINQNPALFCGARHRHELDGGIARRLDAGQHVLRELRIAAAQEPKSV